VLTATTGTSKSSHLTVSGTPALTFTGDGALPASQMLVRASRVASTSKFQFEVTVTSSNNAELDIGIDNGSMNFSLDTGEPGRTDSSGLYIKLLPGGYNIGWAADTSVGQLTGQSSYWPAGTVLTVEVDTAARTLKLYRNGVLMNETLGFGVGGQSSFTNIPASAPIGPSAVFTTTPAAPPSTSAPRRSPMRSVRASPATTDEPRSRRSFA
jgi:hypothetical protein